jgi:hypothetical protein
VQGLDLRLKTVSYWSLRQDSKLSGTKLNRSQNEHVSKVLKSLYTDRGNKQAN